VDERFGDVVSIHKEFLAQNKEQEHLLLSFSLLSHTIGLIGAK